MEETAKFKEGEMNIDVIIDYLINLKAKLVRLGVYEAEFEPIPMTEHDAGEKLLSSFCLLLSIPRYLLCSKTRKRNIVKARQIITAIIKNNTKLSLTAIGELFNQDHASVLHSIKEVNNQLDVDRSYKADYLNIVKKLEVFLTTKLKH